MKSPKIALLIFARSIEEELKYKPFLAHKSFISLLHNNALSLAKKCSLPIIVHDESKQSGKDFGSRFTNALQKVFDDGYDSVIAIGNDCPHLNKNHITQAEKALQVNETVLGGTIDGGFYLVGISKHNFSKGAFLSFNWEKGTLFNEVFQFLSKASSKCQKLQKLRDIDALYDLKVLQINTIQSSAIRKCILLIILKKTRIFSFKKLSQLLFSSQVILNKGSPNKFVLHKTV